MKHFLKCLSALLIFAILLSGCGVLRNTRKTEYKIGFTPAVAGDAFFVAMEDGVTQAVKDASTGGTAVRLTVYKPDGPQTITEQIGQVKRARRDGMDALIIASTSTTGLNAELRKAVQGGMKLIYVDSPATFRADATFSTDNFEAARKAGLEMKNRLQAKGIMGGTIGIVASFEEMQSTKDRVNGFISAFEHSTFNVSDVRYSEGLEPVAKRMATEMIKKGYVGIFAGNDYCSTGCGNAVKETNADIVTVGFDNSPSNRRHVREGHLNAFIAQRPEEMGQQAVKTALRLMNGKKMNGFTAYTTTDIVTKENVDLFGTDEPVQIPAPPVVDTQGVTE